MINVFDSRIETLCEADFIREGDVQKGERVFGEADSFVVQGVLTSGLVKDYTCF